MSHTQANIRIYKNDIARRLYAYESTGLTPEEIKHLKPQSEDSFIEHLNMLCDVKDKYIAVLQLLCEDVENTAIKYRAFYEFNGEYLCRDCYVKAMIESAETKNGGECCGCCEDADILYELDGDWLCRKCFEEAIFELDNSISAERMTEYA